MVLLSASTVSTILSGGIICLFTFLLFLSGYILQQNAVESLRTALEAPLEERVNFDNRYIRNDPVNIEVVTEVVAENDNNTQDTIVVIPESPQIVLTGDVQARDVEATAQQLWHAHIDQAPVSSIPPIPEQKALKSTGRFAYVLSVPRPSDLCSAILFAEQHKQSSLPAINIVFLYPASWESSRDTRHNEALATLLKAEHQHGVILHPVPISKVWTGIDVASQLLSELARNPWPYDRVMYLKMPGMVIDANMLDRVMVRTYADKRLLRSGWERLRSRRTGSPDMMLFAQGRGLMNMIENTVTTRATIEPNENVVRDAAFVVFEEKDLKEEQDEDTIFGRFRRQRADVCEGTSLLE